MNNYQSYKDYKSDSKGKTGPGKKPKPRQNTKPVSESLRNDKPKNKSKPKPPQNKKRIEENKRKLAAQKRFAAEKKRIDSENKKDLKIARQIEKKEMKEKRRQAIKSNSKTLLIACFVAFYVGISMVILYNNSKIAQMQYNVNEIKKEIEKEMNYKNELEAERESTFKSETIENYAKYRLDMVYPSKDQTVYINID